MQIFKKSAVCFTILLVFLALCTEEVEGRRKVLKGRRTITRHYRRGPAIPAWAIITIVGFSYIIIGGALYALLRKVIVQQPIENVNSYTPAMMDDTVPITP